MTFHLTPTITISTETDLESALTELAAEGVDESWLTVLRRSAERHLQPEEIETRIETPAVVAAALRHLGA